MPELPPFSTRRLCLRGRSESDLEANLTMDRDPAVTRFTGVRWTDAVSHRAYVEARMRHAYPPGMGYWSVLSGSDFIGWILLAPLDLHGPEIEIGWRLVRRAWGRGYATEAARAVLGHGLTTLELSKVVADILPANAASIRVAEKLGMRLEGPADHGGYRVSRYLATPAG